MCDLANGRSDRVVDDQQVVVGVERELVWEERPLVRGGRPGQLVGEGAPGREGGCSEGKRAEEPTAAGLVYASCSCDFHPCSVS